jgi:exodeoxyribonuclease V
MIKNHVKFLLEQNLSFTPTDCQLKLLNGLADFISSNASDEIFLIKGYAGTGKTAMINVLTQTLHSLKFKVVLLAPTGRAAKVMAGYTSFPAFTIHKIIYRQKSSSDDKGQFVIDKNFSSNTWFIVDEASMISNEGSDTSYFGSGKLLNDLLEYVYSGTNCRLVLAGDSAQLPPVGLSISPALDPEVFKHEGFVVRQFLLTQVVRQAANSGILTCATQIRKKIQSGKFSEFFTLNIDGFSDIERCSGAELVELITSCYSKYGLNETIIITRSNKRANLYNRGIRGSVFYRENEIERGDLLMVVKNNYFWIKENEDFNFIANGEFAEVISIYNYEEMYGFRFANVCLRFFDYEDLEIDCKIFLDVLSSETASLSSDQTKSLFDLVSEDYEDIKNKRVRWQKVRENPYYNALQVKYAYALTCHKAQGGQWQVVFLDHGYLLEEMIDYSFGRWLYTAFTRPVEKLYLVNFNKNFFKNINNTE